MTGKSKSRQDLLSDIADLRLRLEEAEETLNAIRRGEVDAIVGASPNDRIYTLQGAERPYRIFYEAMREGAVTMTREGLILHCNGRFAEMLGVRPEQMAGMFFVDFVADDARQSVSSAMSNPASAGRSVESSLKTSSGESRPVNISMSLLQVGEQEALCAVVTDLSQLRMMQRIEVANAALEAANKELDAFAYSVSHDLRAPLRGIDSFSRILQEKHASQMDGDALHCLQMVRESAAQMRGLINDLLAFSRLGQEPLRKAPVDHENLVRTVLKELESEQEGRRIDLSLGELPPVDADLNMLKLVWVNLISNALKYTRGKDTTVIRMGSQSQGRVPVYFVQDNGVGFDMRYAHKLFGMFQRLHRAEDYEGTGVGLAIAHRIVSRHGGRIWAQSTKGEGAAFYFTLQSEDKAVP